MDREELERSVRAEFEARIARYASALEVRAEGAVRPLPDGDSLITLGTLTPPLAELAREVFTALEGRFRDVAPDVLEQITRRTAKSIGSAYLDAALTRDQGPAPSSHGEG